MSDCTSSLCDVKFVFRAGWLLLIQKAPSDFRAVFIFKSVITVTITTTGSVTVCGMDKLSALCEKKIHSLLSS
jgi:hypothetical protein